MQANFELSKGNIKKLKSKLKEVGSKSGYMNQDQLVSLLCYALDRKESEHHNYAVAVTRAIMGTNEGMPRFEWGKDPKRTMEDFFV